MTGQSATVTARLEDDDAALVQLLVAQTENLQDAAAIDGMSDDEGVVRIDLSDLEPNTQYHYSFVVEGEVDRSRVGRFRTYPQGPAELNIAVGSCSRTGSNGAVFDAIRSLDPDLVIIDGDLHYADITRNDPQAFRQVLDHTLSRPAQAALFQQCAVAYVWDDHDYGGQDRDSDSRPAAMAAYRQFVPHHPLASETSAVYQAFSTGRVRVLLTDARSERRPADDDDPGTMLGDDQKRWLLDELLAARDSHGLTIWANPVPWIAAESEPSDDEAEGDDWGGYPEERAEIASFIAEHGIASSLLMVSGDAHMVAIDDGTNSDFSGTGAAGFPVLHAGALDRPGSVKGGPYSHGAVPGGGQFGLVSIRDDGSKVDVTLTGRTWTNAILLEHTFMVG